MDTIKFNKNKYFSLIETISEYRKNIKVIHIWGKKKSESGRWVVHPGNMDTYFANNDDNKSSFIKGILTVSMIIGCDFCCQKLILVKLTYHAL